VHSNSFSLSALQTVGPKAGSAAAAQGGDQGTSTQSTSGAPASGGSTNQPAPSFGMAFLLPLLILVPFFFFSSRRQKKEQAERAKMKRGDKVVSNSGLVGELMELDERFAKVKLAPGITVQMLASTLGPLDVPDASAPKSTDKDDLKDLKDAKVLADKSAPAK
jgi:preprotein translocase subunit YajC